MTSITQILMNLFSPQVFWSIVGALSLVFIVVVIISIFSDKKSKEADEGLQKRINELTNELAGKDVEFTSLKDKFNTKEAEARKQLIRLEEQINENESSKTKIKSLEVTLKEKDDALAKAKITLEEADKKLKASQPEIDKARKETALKQEMYSGLKGQYDELEAQVADKAKKLQDELDKNKKLQDQIKELQVKLEGALKHKETVREKEKDKVIPAPAVDQKPLTVSQQPAKEEHKPIAPQEVKQAAVNKEEPLPVVPKEEKKPEAQASVPGVPSPAGAPVAPPTVQKEKSQVQVSQIDKQKAASQASEKSKLPPKSEAKVRLAQVMQEAAKVAAKMEENKKNETENKNSPEQKKEDSQSPEKDKPQA